MFETRQSRVTVAESLVAISAGFAAFWYAVGLRVLDVTNVRWLLIGDSAQAYLGWEFFRKAPLLQWPLGNNPNFGTGFSSSIVFADGIPLVSIVLKPIVSWYDSPVQFHGWWLLTAFVGQAVLSVKILERLGTSVVVRLIALPLLLVQPAFLDRMRFEGYGHMALSAHWLILLGLWLYLRHETTRTQWTLALIVAIGVTLYYFVILGVMYLGWVATRVLRTRVTPSDVTGEVARVGASGAAAVVFVWVIGGFASTSLGDSGLGTYRATLASLLDPSTLNGASWTRLSMIGDITNLPGTQEGFAFLGVASLILIGVAFVSFRYWVPRVATVQVGVFAVVVLVFFVLAISPRIALGPREVATYQWPNVVSDMLSVVRASGRLMWIPMYVVMFFAIVVIGRIAASGSRVATPILVLLVLFHIVDTTNGVNDVRSRFNDTQPSFVTDDSRWDEWARGKQHLVAIPPLSNDPRWLDLAVLAERNGLTTNAAYVSRKDEAAFVDLSLRLQAALERREFAQDTLYVVTNYPPNPESAELLAEYLREPNSQLRVYQVEELTVIVP